MKKALFILTLTLFISCMNESESTIIITKKARNSVIKELLNKSHNKFRIIIGVNQVASLWKNKDGDYAEFKQFCIKNFMNNTEDLKELYEHIDNYFETLNGHFNQISLKLQEPMQLTKSKYIDIDKKFAEYDVSAHIKSDFFNNKIAFIIALNFPNFSLKEKNELAEYWTRGEWAYSRIGDMFTERIPSKLIIEKAKISAETDNYVATYNIYAGELLNKDNKTIFPKGMKLLCHWNLRDEIKSNYSFKDKGIEKQELIYQVMKRIINQEIPSEVINSDKYQWNPITNKLFKDSKEIKFNPENNIRYQQIINCFKSEKEIDKYTNGLNTFIKRKFNGEMQISQEDVEKLFIEFVSSPQVKKVAELIKSRLGRNLKPYDIWYDGFKLRSLMNEDKLSIKTRKKYPNASAFENDLENLLQKLGFSAEKSKFLSSKISVDPARGAGHAWGAQMQNGISHLRTRIPENGMDYKAYNIAIHELGHNVEQTFSLRTGYYALRGVPNTGFTEALAFLFQKRDLLLLDKHNSIPNAEHLDCLDIFWSIYEIMGVSLVDMNVWKWLYKNPNSTALQLKNETIKISKDIWNKYYAPIFKIKDQEILAIYSHMISYPLYLSAYPYGKIIEFQLDNYIKGKNFAKEVERIFKIGNVTPNTWMQQAVDSPLSIGPILRSVETAIEKVK